MPATQIAAAEPVRLIPRNVGGIAKVGMSVINRI